MNILIYTETSPFDGKRVGGAETSLRLLAQTLAGRGHKVIYLTHSPRKRFPGYSRETIDGVEVHRLRWADLPSLGYRPLLVLRKRFDELLFDRTVRRLTRTHNIEIVHTYHEVPAMYRFLKLRERHGLPYSSMLRIGGLYWTEKLARHPDLKSHYRYVFERVDCMNPNTPGLYELYREHAAREGMELTRTEPFTADIGIRMADIPVKWNPPAGPFTNKNPFRMVMASRLSLHQKRQELLLEAVARIPDHLPVKLDLIGDGPNREHLERMIEEKRLSGRVSMTPFLPQEALWKRLAGSHLYVHACDFEGLSKIILEAMGIGMPVLASNVVPLTDYITDNETGFLAENSHQAWASRITELADKPVLLTRVGDQARRDVRIRFSPEVNITAYEKQFEKLLARKR